MKPFFLISILLVLSNCGGGGVVSQGFGRPPVVITFEAATFDFGLAGTGTTATGTVNVTVDGGVAATNINATTSAPFGLLGGTYPGTGGTCTTSEQNSHCTIVVSYSPVVVGSDSATLTVSYNVGSTTYTSTMTLTGYTQAVLTISDGPTYDYGIKAVGSVTDKVLTVSRAAGGATATNLGAPVLSTPFSFKGGTYPGTGGTCSGTLPNSITSCTMVITYNPMTLAAHSTTLTLFYNDGISNTSTTRTIAGTGVPPAVLTVSDVAPPAAYNFGTRAVGAIVSKTFTVTYASGGVPATSLSGSGLATNYVFRGGSYPGTGGTCGTTLSSGTCTIVIEFRPQTVATHDGTMVFSYFDGAFPQTVSRNVTGIGVPPAVLSVSPTTFNYGLVRTSQTLDQSFTVTHTSGGVAATGFGLTGISVPYVYPGGSFPGTGGNCTTTINIGTSCTVVVRYAPTSTGTFNRTLGFAYNDGAFAQSIPVSLTGTTQAGLAINGFTYGSKVTGTVTTGTHNVIYSGGTPATAITPGTLTAPFSWAGGSYPGTGGTCGTTISANCTVRVNFTPVANGTFNDTISLGYNDGFTGQTATRSISGTGVAATVLSVSDAGTYDYGNVVTTTFATKTYTVTYVSGTLAATGLGTSGLAAPFSVTPSWPGGGTCGTSISSGTCTFIVRYSPTANVLSNRTFNFNYNDGAVVQSISRTVQGTGILPAILTVSDTGTYDFGNVATGTSADKTYTVTYSSGQATATALSVTGLAAPYSFKGGTYPGTGGTCGTTLSSGTCTIVMTYSPVSIGSSSNTFTFSYHSGATTQNVSRTMQGNTEGLLTISDGATYNFGNVATGATASKTFTVSYSGGAAATTMAGVALSAPYSFAGGSYPGGGTCGTTLSSGTCTIIVNYSPSTVATHNATLQINYNNGFGATNAQRPMTGVGIAPATLAFSPSTTYDFGTHAVTEPTDVTFTVTKGGTAVASSMSGSALSTPYSYKGGSYPGTGGTCSTSLSSGTCTVVVTYTPNSASVHNSTVAMNYFDGANNQSTSRSLTGTGAAWAYISISDGPTYNFGTKTVGSTTDKTFIVTNSGAVTATSVAGIGLTAPYSFKGGAYPGTGGGCSTTLPVGSCTIVVSYRPTSTGVTSGTIQIVYNNGNTTVSATRGVTGTGAFAPFSIENLASFIFESRKLQNLFEINDLNHDGYKEKISGLSIFDGWQQKLLYQLKVNIPKDDALITSSDDYDGDGIEDILFSERKNAISHFRGVDGSQFNLLESPRSCEQFGNEIYDYVDLDNDGIREFIVLDKEQNVYIYGQRPTYPLMIIDRSGWLGDSQ
ncbi:MAG: hypothetical protein A4S09_07870 [Proteobacteria bacterium SG_bin7]|nr:MAG: hypothetical protein A4S09_07870 [Proteobacteria bacterium SG_bin7]